MVVQMPIVLLSVHFVYFFRPGDKWALCAVRWYQAYRAGKAPYVKLSATNKKALTIVPLNILEKFNDNQFNP